MRKKLWIAVAVLVALPGLVSAQEAGNQGEAVRAEINTPMREDGDQGEQVRANIVPPMQQASYGGRNQGEQWGTYNSVEDIPLDDVLFSGANPVLTEKDRYAIMLAKNWQEGRAMQMNPVVGLDGAVEYLHNAEQPTIVCAPYFLTDIEFQPGETIRQVLIGDSFRWKVQPADSQEGRVQHIVITPKEIGLNTSLVVTTSRRTYHMRLISHRTEYIPKVKFGYMEDSLNKWNAIRQERAEERERNTIPETHEYLGDLDFGYTITGRASWKPVRVFNDGVKTIIEMPAAMRQTEAPTLLVVRKDGRIFKKQEQTLVNYRVQQGRYIVDSIFDKAVMIVGVGGNQDRVTITRNVKRGEKR